MSKGFYKINLLTDPNSARAFNAIKYEATLRDIHRSIDLNFKFNGKATKLPTSELASISENERYLVFLNFMAKEGNGIIPYGKTWNRFFCGLYQYGFQQATQQVITSVADPEKGIFYVGVNRHTKKSKEDYAVCLNENFGENLTLFDTKVTLDVRQTIDPKTSAITLTIVEHVDVIDFNKKEVCASFATTSAITGNTLKYFGTTMDIKTDLGKKLFTDTRSILALIKAFFEKLIFKQSKSDKHSLTFFKPSRACKADLPPKSQPASKVIVSV